MTSLFDQFEQASMKTRNNNFTTAEMVMTKVFTSKSQNSPSRARWDTST
jgi:hypothetical protein